MVLRRRTSCTSFPRCFGFLLGGSACVLALTNFSCGGRRSSVVYMSAAGDVGGGGEEERACATESVADPTAFGLNGEAVDRLVRKAEQEGSTALIVFRDGRRVVEEYWQNSGRPSIAMSVTKSITALGVGALIDDERLSLDRPLSEYVLPEWKESKHAQITLRHLLTQTSGLEAERDWKKTILEQALASRQLSEPGQQWEYNNNAVDLLSLIARRSHPENLFFDDYLQYRLFSKLDVVGAYWVKDNEGHPRAAGELIMRPIDLAKFGQLVLQKGEWKGEQILPKEWVTEMLDHESGHPVPYGFLWWRNGRVKSLEINEVRLERLRADGVSQETVEALEPWVGKAFTSRGSARDFLEMHLSEQALREIDGVRSSPFVQRIETLAYRADGWLGQYIIIVPSARLVAVRMRDPRIKGADPKQFSYSDFLWDVLSLAGLDVAEGDRV